MDIYIKMCECSEIQKQWKPKDGDFYFNKNLLKVLIYPYGNPVKFVDIWLPRQDDYQGMLEIDGELDYSLEKLIKEFYEFYIISEGVMPHPIQKEENEWWQNYINQFMSMQQLWCAFYMKEKHNKIWDGEKWMVKELRS